MTPSENVLAIAKDLLAAIERVPAWAQDYGGMRFVHYVLEGYVRRNSTIRLDVRLDDSVLNATDKGEGTQ